MRVEAENGATAGKTDLAKRAKALNLDAIHDTVHEMARDEARHGKHSLVCWLDISVNNQETFLGGGIKSALLFRCLQFYLGLRTCFELPVVYK